MADPLTSLTRVRSGGAGFRAAGATNPFGQSPDAGPIERWALSDTDRSVAISIEWRPDDGCQSTKLMLELYHGGDLIAAGEADADYGIEALFADVLRGAPPAHRRVPESPEVSP